MLDNFSFFVSCFNFFTFAVLSEFFTAFCPNLEEDNCLRALTPMPVDKYVSSLIFNCLIFIALFVL